MSALDKSNGKLKVAIIEGFHPFDIPQWNELWHAMSDEFDCYLQHIDNWAVDCAQCRGDYDVHLFYNMNMKLEESPFKDVLEASLKTLGETGQGVFLLHHSILAYPENAEWSKMAGIADRSFGYHPDQDFTMEVANDNHPISTGLSACAMHDETYTMQEPGANCDVLFTVDHDPSMTALGWTLEYKKSRVVCFQPGHDHLAYENPAFREVVRRGIRWAARKS